jgi:hypothetical protein
MKKQDKDFASSLAFLKKEPQKKIEEHSLMWMCKSQNTTLALCGKQHQTPPRP